MSRRLPPGSLLVAGTVFLLVLAGCGATSGASVEFKAAPTPEDAPGGAVTPQAGEATAIPPRLAFEEHIGEAVAMENGGRVPLGEDKVVEVFLAPYPPDWRTDLHLFLLDSKTYEPVTDATVGLTYEMVYMDHGTERLSGRELRDGHYVLPLPFLMYGDWRVEVTVRWPQGAKQLRFIVKFYP